MSTFENILIYIYRHSSTVVECINTVGSVGRVIVYKPQGWRFDSQFFLATCVLGQGTDHVCAAAGNITAANVPF